jgi:hypothetical protein
VALAADFMAPHFVNRSVFGGWVKRPSFGPLPVSCDLQKSSSRGQATDHVFQPMFIFFCLTFSLCILMYKQLLATDLLGLATMKNAAKCDK